MVFLSTIKSVLKDILHYSWVLNSHFYPWKDFAVSIQLYFNNTEEHFLK